ncbi:hypothetical protein FDP41_001061 [Naegleria fowleri]|uniref:Uncharacterized protein n=1 Tax=Naegleria fowleri TaxID=5763 RepID=A0A6A5C1Y0_NAEFO|nr:uncharacterized protein FDP41_001061 [Naegleria fowleri]KAF0979908.1 hypothetical protein FDP41_001061 [Naegleria fowleri]CAG4708193.1 unnamed protein product [Naegleria fowleri]
MQNRLLEEEDDQQLLTSNTKPTSTSAHNHKNDSRFAWWKMKKNRRSHFICWLMILTSGVLLTVIGLVSMILLVIYSPTPKEILDGKGPISDKQWKEIVLETFGILSGFVIGIGLVMSITPLICSCYIMNPKEFQIPGIHDDEEDDGL